MSTVVPFSERLGEEADGRVRRAQIHILSINIVYIRICMICVAISTNCSRIMLNKFGIIFRV